MTRIFRHISVAFAASVLLGCSTTAFAAKPYGITDAEWALLPPYCPHTMGFKGHTQPYISRWESVIGPGFFHLHHYCWALIALSRAQRAYVPAAQRHNQRQEALGDLYYVVRNTDDNFILLPEIMTRIGRTELLLKNADRAAAAFTKARALKPDYWPAYSYWAEFLRAQGRKPEALEVVKNGLQYSPDAKTLLALFKVLGGRPEDIPPPIKKDEAPAAPLSENNEAAAPAESASDNEDKP